MPMENSLMIVGEFRLPTALIRKHCNLQIFLDMEVFIVATDRVALLTISLLICELSFDPRVLSRQKQRRRGWLIESSFTARRGAVMVGRGVGRSRYLPPLFGKCLEHAHSQGLHLSPPSPSPVTLLVRCYIASSDEITGTRPPSSLGSALVGSISTGSILLLRTTKCFGCCSWKLIATSVTDFPGGISVSHFGVKIKCFSYYEYFLVVRDKT